MANYLEGYNGVKVLGARVVVKIEIEEETKSGIILMADSKEPKYEGIVVATGSGARLENGTLMPMDVAPGDRVIYSRMAGVPIKFNNEDLLVINERDIIAVIELPNETN